MPILFGVTMFVSALLLFLIQPMVGKMILPLLGGTPAVWNSCMVFFQALLLAGYYYSHRTSQQLPTKRQVTVHTIVLVASVGVLLVGAAMTENHSPIPIVKSLAPQGSTMPFFGVLLLLAVAIGLPFFTVSTTAPLLQKWFSETGHPSAKDPYFLYAASNFGSLLSLLLYPILIEPQLRLVEQAWLFAVGFIILAGMIVYCGRVVRNAPAALKPTADTKDTKNDPNAPTFLTKLRWLVLAAVPSSLMLSVTTDVTTDVVSMPMLWIIPLALYLITFIIVFSKSVPSWVHLMMCLLTPVVLLLVAFMKTSQNIASTNTSYLSFKAQLAVQFIAFFLVTMTCHGELARTRPSPKYLTNFYLLMSVGGMLGGVFNALVAPVVFTFISEFPLTVIAAFLVLPKLSEVSGTAEDKPAPAEGTADWTWVYTVVFASLFFVLGRFGSRDFSEVWRACNWLLETVGLDSGNPRTMATIVAFGLPILACYMFVERPLRLGLCVGMFWLGTFVTFLRSEAHPEREFDDGTPLYTRSFFGTMKVDNDGEFMRLVHGTTLHGLQYAYPDHESIQRAMWLMGANTPTDAMALGVVANEQLQYPGREPLTYYHRTGPVGSMFQEFWDRIEREPNVNTDVACIGLGTGSLSCYGRDGQKLTFFEIDWTVRKIAENPLYFTYLTRAKQQGTELEFLMGDARLTLEQHADRKWGFMLVDAFSSDSIPAHMLTKEAVKLYFDRLNDGGIVALHISNRYLKLEPVVERIVRELGYSALVMHDYAEDSHSGKTSSTWVAVTRKKEHLGSLNFDPRWGELKGDPKIGLWTDDYTPIIHVLSGEWDIMKYFR